ncbi:TonB-dependent receptor [Maribellus maritimus]|uniref:TonB-dependent receptor n=1 Tax=Maribellus maritimus TaxID=2870838 RepID=UPI001EE9CB9A|nr:TonB-dependent receptor [Maribellus maritimus]MCG6190411.1 TonB-dependent receptor [Maribellus maritimus]
MKKVSLLLLMQLITFATFAQFTLYGVVKGNDEPLAGASVVIKNTFYGVSTNEDGSFLFRNLKKGTYHLKVSFIGFETEEVQVNLNGNKDILIELKPNMVLTDEILISATRAKEKTPMTYSNVTQEELESKNLGQDIPYLLQLTPSFVTTSDAGAGVGYTNFRIRGTDLNRINVSIDGIPISEAESHGTWFVDIPDLASSLENIQIQRGVGTSANGAAAFGGTIDLQTNTLQKDAYAEYRTAVGSFNTFKNTVSTGTGLIDGKFTFDARLSKVSSDGFVDRAFSDLKSFFLSGGYYTGKSVLKLNIFSGFEETYQSWWGVPSVRLNNDMEGMQRYADHWLYSEKQTEEMINSDNRTYNYYTYENQVDHYQQDYYHLHFSHQFSENLYLNTGLHYRHGRGYYENFKYDEDLKKDYNIPYPIVGNDTIFSSDLVNRKWLDNDFYGVVFALNHKKEKADFTLGGGWNTYDGDHFGNVIWAQYLGNVAPNYEWYRGNGLKKDFNIYGKFNYLITETFNIYVDLQYRHINYKIAGIDDDLTDITQKHNYDFFNPKLGVLYQPANNQKLYLSFAVAHREPNRDNFVDADAGETPLHERLFDLELGYNYQSSNFTAGANLYYMNYKNQLVLTGEINDVGGAIMANMDKSYRAGLELQAGWKIERSLQWNINATLSKNKIKNFTEHVDDWDTPPADQRVFELGTTDLAFSPHVNGNSQFIYSPAKNLNFNFISSYVGKQYIDNTSNNDRILDAYFINNLKVDYNFKTPLFTEIVLHIMVNNLFNKEYESNAWVYSYYLGGERFKQDGYFPQAGTHFMLGIDFKF